MNSRMIRTTALAVAIAAGLAAGIRAQQVRDSSAPSAAPRVGTAVLSGMVVTDEQTPRPVRRATITVTSSDGSVARTTFTDESGRFTVSSLPEGRYTLMANKPPYLRTSYGAKRYDTPGTPITLKDAGKMGDLTLRLVRGAVLSGRITDENGEPAFGVSVRAMLLRTQAGERAFVPSATGTSFDTTDDHGVFRLFGLPPGEYAITASPRLANGEIRAMTENEIRSIMQALQQQQTAAQNVQAMGATAPGQKPATPTPTPAPTPTPDPNRVTVAYSTVFYPGTTVAASAGTVTVGPGDERTGIDFPLRLVRTTTVEGTVIVPPGIAPQSVQLMMIPNTGGAAGLASLDNLPFQRIAVGPDGKFKYTSVAPGQYTISAQATKPGGAGPNGLAPPPPPPPPGVAGGQVMTFSRVVTSGGGGGGGEMPMDVMMIGGDPNGSAYWAQADLGVDGSPVSGVTLTLQPGMTITGRVEFRSLNVRSGDLKRVQLNLMPAPTGNGGLRITTSFPVVQVDETTGKFTITGVVPGRYTLRGVAPVAPGSPAGPAWRLGAAMIKGRDVLDFPLDVRPNEEINDAVIVFTDATQSIGGSLQDASGRPAPDYTIVVFSADKAYWTLQSRRVRTVRPGTDGRFNVTNLPDGDYRMAAVVDMAPNDINDPAFLEQLVGASFAIKLGPGEQKTQDLKISGGL